MAEDSAAAFLQERGLSEITVNIIVHRLGQAGYVSNKEQRVVEDLRHFARLCALLDETGRCVMQ